MHNYLYFIKCQSSVLCCSPVNARAHPGPSFGNATDGFLMTQVNCNGDEDDIFDCAHVLGANTCHPSEAAAVTCVPMDNVEPDSKLVTWHTANTN